MVNFMYYCTISGSTVADLHYGMDEQHPDCIAFKLTLTEKISELCDKGINDFICNSEYGMPMWAAEIIVGIRNFRKNPPRIHLIIPHEGQANRWSDEVRERYFNLHQTADSVIILNKKYNNDCYSQTDEFMLKRSILLLTDFENGFLIDYAKSNNKSIELIKVLTLQ